MVARHKPTMTNPPCFILKIGALVCVTGLPSRTAKLIQANPMNLGWSLPTPIITALITTAIVRLSATGEMKNASTAVNQNKLL